MRPHRPRRGPVASTSATASKDLLASTRRSSWPTMSGIAPRPRAGLHQEVQGPDDARSTATRLPAYRGRGLAAIRRYGIHGTPTRGEPDRGAGRDRRVGEADRQRRRAPATPSFPYWSRAPRRPRDRARSSRGRASHLDAARSTSASTAGSASTSSTSPSSPSGEGRWTDAEAAIHEAASGGRSPMPPSSTSSCAPRESGFADLAALARARRDTDAVRGWLAGPGADRYCARRRRRGRGHTERGRVARGRRSRVRARQWRRTSRRWAGAAAAWDRLERPPVAAYCRWRQAETLVAAGSSRTEAVEPLRKTHAVAVRLAASRCSRSSSCSRNAPGSTSHRPTKDRPAPAGSSDPRLTPREAEVLTSSLAATPTARSPRSSCQLKTASVHVSHILAKLDAPNRTEAAAIAHRVARIRPRPPRSSPHA